MKNIKKFLTLSLLALTVTTQVDAAKRQYKEGDPVQNKKQKTDGLLSLVNHLEDILGQNGLEAQKACFWNVKAKCYPLLNDKSQEDKWTKAFKKMHTSCLYDPIIMEFVIEFDFCETVANTILSSLNNRLANRAVCLLKNVAALNVVNLEDFWLIEVSLIIFNSLIKKASQQKTDQGLKNMIFEQATAAANAAISTAQQALECPTNVLRNSYEGIKQFAEEFLEYIASSAAASK